MVVKNVKNNGVMITLLLLVATVLTRGVFAQDKLPEITVFTNPLPFFSETGSKSIKTGYSVELARLIAEEAGYQPNFQAMPWARILMTADTQVQALILGLARTPSRENDYHWITPISSNAVAIFVNQSPTIPLTNLALVDQFGLVGVLRDDYRHKILQQNNMQNSISFSSWELAVGSLLKGRIASLFFSDMGIVLTCFNAQLDCTSIKKVFTYQVTDSFIAMPKHAYTEKTAKTFIKAAATVKTSQAFSVMLNQYLNRSDTIAESLIYVDGAIKSRVKP